MQPLSPEEKKDLTDRGATEEEIQEYQTLLSELFAKEPDVPLTEENRSKVARVAELFEKFKRGGK